jgi:hypothetical protein
MTFILRAAALAFFLRRGWLWKRWSIINCFNSRL